MTDRAPHQPIQRGLFDPIVIDSFAGGGGASLGIELATGFQVDYAVNHDPEAVIMHRANHPGTVHACQDVWSIDPARLAAGRPVQLLWASPDCKHFSKAKGGKPRAKNIRDLAWVVVKWARAIRPRVIMLENVEEFSDWGPLGPDGRPCPKRKGTTFRRWVGELERQGYVVEWRELRACDYGAPTIRKRLFLIARCDGQPIIWPEPTHGPGLTPYRTAAEILDFSLPCPSIFDSSEEIWRKHGLRARRPLADATLRRIAEGIQRFVIDAAEPFIVSNMTNNAPQSIHRPVSTILTGNHKYLVAPTLVQTSYGERKGQRPRYLDIHEPLGTVVAGGCKHAVASAFLTKLRGTCRHGAPLTDPAPTITAGGNHAALVTAFLAQHNGGMVGHDLRTPVSTISSRGSQQQLVTALLAPYYGSGSGETGRDLREPVPTLTTKGRLKLITVTIDGVDYAITDIGMRMLTPRELYRAQGFPDWYRIDGDGEHSLTKTAQIRMVGNSVSPNVARALVDANLNAGAIASTALRTAA